MERFDRSVVASFDVDAQKGFTPLCPDELPVAGGDEIVSELNHLASLASVRVGSKDAHSRSAHWLPATEAARFTSIEGDAELDKRWPAHCVVGERGYESLDGLPAEMDYDYFVYKGVSPGLHPYGACYHNRSGKLRSTGAIEFLASRGIKAVLLGGLATDYCVKETAIQLAAAGFVAIVHLPACRGIAADLSEAIGEMKAAGVRVVASREELAAFLKRPAPSLGR
jgi:nicotinamidase/pyrazinamidase